MTIGTRVLVVALALVSIWYALQWFLLERRRAAPENRTPRVLDVVLGFVTDFLDTLGIGSFAPTTAIFKLWRRMPDEQIPGTLNAGHALPTLAEGLIFVAAVTVDLTTLVSMITAATAGAWFGAGTVSRLRRRTIQVAMGSALLIASLLFVATNLQLMPGGGHAIGLSGGRLAVAVAVNFVLGGLMTLGIGLYAPCLILVSLLGMNPLAAFPIMMASSAFVMPIGGVRFIRSERYSARAALGLAIGGVPGVIIAAYVVKSLPIVWLRWLVVIVVLYAAVLMLSSAWRPHNQS
ncbi:MAG TPA: sulfite exporter TauE/SafE family protein [Steroidobacteraceae bacterium]|nr:sulfite exporter TauE/SafE family protein [Steroidobacteraceae bacterium]